MRLFLLLVMAIGASNTFGQEKGDGKLILTNNLSSEENYLAVGKTLLMQEFEIREKDDTFHRLMTEPRIIQVDTKRGHQNFYIIIHVNCFDNKVVFTAQHKRRGSSKINTTYNSTIWASAGVFKRLKKVAEGVAGEITYEK